MNDGNGFGERLSEFVLGVIGVVLLLSLMAIWVSWSETMFLLVLATGATAGVFYCVLYAFHDALYQGHLKPSVSGRTILTDKFAAEMHRLTYHHRDLGDAVFRRKTERLRSLLYDAEEAEGR